MQQYGRLEPSNAFACYRGIDSVGTETQPKVTSRPAPHAVCLSFYWMSWKPVSDLGQYDEISYETTGAAAIRVNYLVSFPTSNVLSREI